MSDGSGSTTWVYGDARGRLTKETKVISGAGGGAFVTQWAYDSADQVTSMTYPDNEVVSFAYLNQGLLNSVGGTTYVSNSQYDAAGRIELRKLGNDQVRTDYVYNGWSTQGGRLQQIKSGPPANLTALQQMTYSYDTRGNVSSIVDANAGGTQTQSFGYDSLNRLTSAGASGGTGGTYSTVSYSYDVNGRLLNGPLGAGYTYNSSHKHAATTAGSYSYAYDANGNMSSRTLSATATNFTYDAENRLVSVSGGATASFVYDGDGQRVKGTVGGVTTAYVGNYYEVSGGTVKKYYYAGSTRIAMKSGATLSWLLGDHLGSTAITVSGTTESGEVRYHPWGADRYSSGSTPTSFKYTGQRQEAGIGLYFYGARWYDRSAELTPKPGVGALHPAGYDCAESRGCGCVRQVCLCAQ
ncbi:MAG: hypothetical protein R3A44_30205 [Caldilineaceae bacterium]